MNLVEWVDAFERELSDSLPFALMDSAMVIADEAVASHTYTNRTGRLQAGTRADSVRGSWRNGYTVTVVGAMPYGSFLEEGASRIQGYAFLLPAYARREAQVETIVADAMALTADRIN